MALDAGKGQGGSDPQAELLKRLELLEKQLGSQQARNAELEKKMAQGQESVLSPDFLEFVEMKKKMLAKQGIQEGPQAEPNWDEMTGREIKENLEKRYQAALAKAIGEATSRVEKLEAGLQNSFGYLDLELQKVREPDFAKLMEDEKGKSTFIDIAKKNPQWTTQQVYQQIKKDRMVAEVEAKQEALRKRAEEVKMISESPEGIPRAGVEVKRPTPQEAAERAWEAAGFDKPTV